MQQPREDLLRRPLYLYSLPEEVLSTLVPKDDVGTGTGGATTTDDAAADTAAATARRPPTPETAGAATLGGQACALCGLTFSTVLDQRGHLKSDLHNYNLKQKLRGLPPVDEAAFERLVGNLDESLSGSDWSSSEAEDDDDNNNDGSSTTVLATLLKKQAVLADTRQKALRKTEAAANATANATANERGDGAAEPRQRDRHAAAAAAAALQPFVWFGSSVLPENTYFGVYRALFTPEELGGGEEADGAHPRTGGSGGRDLVAAVRSRQLAPISGLPQAPAAAQATGYTGRHVFLCMIGGGHFAAMVVALAPRKARAGSVPMNREATVLAHKTFHRYTTRRKQGGSQAANDAAKGAAHSAGSSLRRYNEQALVEDVRALLREWQGLLASAELLFVRATGTTNQRTLFGPYDGQVLQPRDPRLRGFPFNTRRPTQGEIMRAFIELTRLKVRAIVPGRADGPGPGEAGAAATGGTTATTPAPAPAPAPPQRSEEEETALLHTAQLQALARRSKVPALLAYLQTHGLAAASFRFTPAALAQNHHAPTLLHLAAAQNAAPLVSALLLRAGADPTVRNGDGKTPFELAGDRATRDAFRVARGELEAAAAVGGGGGGGGGSSSSSSSSSADPKIDWDAARVPAPLTRAEAEQRSAREKEEATRQEAARRKAEETRLAAEAEAAAKKGASASRKKGAAAGGLGVPKSAQELREEEARGLTPEQRQRLERERRARAAEERMRRMQQGHP